MVDKDLTQFAICHQAGESRRASSLKMNGNQIQIIRAVDCLHNGWNQRTRRRVAKKYSQ